MNVTLGDTSTWNDSFRLSGSSASEIDFTVQLDTGSSDLVILPDKPFEGGKQKTFPGAFANSTYVLGWWAGPVLTAEVGIGKYVVSEQGMCHLGRP